MDRERIISEKIRKDENDYELALCRIAKEVSSNNDIRLVLISGGSCAGKTTTTKKLASLITAMGRHTHTISLDDFYRNEEDAVYLPDGTRDIESINSLEVGLIQSCLCNLIEGREAYIPRFDFISQRRTDNSEQIVLDYEEVAIIEGLHALNPMLFCRGSGNSNSYKVYLHAKNGTDGDPRFIRRLVRDYYYRGADTAETFGQWDIVKHNEPEFIDQFAETADIKLNTFFPYETGVLAEPAIKILSELPTDNKYSEKAGQLTEQLKKAEKIPTSYVPKNSLIQEFIKVN
ncbi:MAG: hypothetical protein PHD46_03775 [Eubacteriales bacterium]|nr:hypothetical protein [Eubacteriales bacterium]MDD4422140.1 hypothetical protein [Eubacteriales bacterium]